MRPILLRVGAALAAVSASSSGALAGNVLTVDPNGQSFTTIQAAIDAAVDGDIVLLKAGTYTSILVDGKSVHVCADQGALVQLTGGSTVRNIPAGKSVTLTGLRGQICPLRATNVLGALRVNDCNFAPIPTPLPPAAVELSACADVAFANCQITGRGGQYGPGPGMVVTGGKVVLDHCSVTGAAGNPGYHNFDLIYPGGPGSTALVSSGTQLFLLGTEIRGGNGGPGAGGDCNSFFNYPSSGGAGGHGVRDDGTSIVRVLDSVVAGGAGGSGGNGYQGTCQQPNGSPGASYLAPQPTIVPIAGVSRELAPIAPAREGAPSSFTVHGLPGDRAYLAVSPGAAHSVSLPAHGVQLFAQPARRVFLGLIGAGGFVTAGLPIPAQPDGAFGSTRFVQAVVVDPSNEVWLATPATLVMLDSSL